MSRGEISVWWRIAEWKGAALTWSCRNLKRELVRAQEEIKRIQSVPLVIGQFMEAIDQKYVLRHLQIHLRRRD